MNDFDVADLAVEGAGNPPTPNTELTAGEGVGGWAAIRRSDVPAEPAGHKTETPLPGQILDRTTKVEARLTPPEFRIEQVRIAFQRLSENPGDAKEIGERLRAEVYENYFTTSSKPDAAAIAEYEAARTWWGVTTGFFQDAAVSHAFDSVRARTAVGQPASGLIVPATAAADECYADGDGLLAANQRALEEFSTAMSGVLRQGAAAVWPKCGDAGKYGAVYTEYCGARMLDVAVTNRWWDEFKLATKKVGTSLTNETLQAQLTLTGLPALEGGSVRGTGGTVMDSVERFHYATHPQPPETKQELFLPSIPALAADAFHSRRGAMAQQGEFILLQESPAATMKGLQRAARKSFKVDPEQPLSTPLRAPARQPPSRCPAPHIKPDHAAPHPPQFPANTAEKALLIARPLTAETCWRGPGRRQER